MTHPAPALDLSRPVADRVAQTTCYMCACRCGINVHLLDDAQGKPRVAYIEGNRDHPVNKGVLCAKGAAGIMQINSPARLRAPLKRVGPRGSGQYQEITWDEALSLAVSWLKPIRENGARKARLLHRPRPVAVLHRLLGAGLRHPQLRRARRFLLGQHGRPAASTRWAAPSGNSAPPTGTMPASSSSSAWPKITTATPSRSASASSRPGAKVVSINPVRTGYNAVADDWLGITPGTDGLLILSLIHCLLKAGKIDPDYLARFTNAPCLVNEDPASPQNGLLLRDEHGKPQVIDRRTGKLAPWDGEGVEPD